MTATTEPCDHPFNSLELDVGRSGQRGQANIQHILCTKCSGRFVDARGVAMLIASGARDSVDIWAAIKELGGKPPKRAVAVRGERPTKETCQHFLAWLRVDGTAARGATGNVSVRCVGCRQSWNQAGGLKIFLERFKEDRQQIRAALRALGAKFQ